MIYMIRRLSVMFKERRHKKWRERIWSIPRHRVKVIETESAVYVDNKRIDNVVADSVQVESLGKDSKKVTFSFVAKSFQKIN